MWCPCPLLWPGAAAYGWRAHSPEGAISVRGGRSLVVVSALPKMSPASLAGGLCDCSPLLIVELFYAKGLVAG